MAGGVGGPWRAVWKALRAETLVEGRSSPEL